MPISKLKASSIASGTIDNARIPSLAASKIGSGTFDDARIAASNVSQHATSFDDNKLVNDLSTLGLRVHTQENLAASNTNSQYIDVFQDATGYTNGADTARNASEYISTVIPAGFATDTSGTLTTSLTDVLNFDNNVTSETGTTAFTLDNSPTYDTSTKKLGTHSIFLDNSNEGVNFNYNSTNAPKFQANQPFSFAVWLYRNANTSTWQMIYDGYQSGGHPSGTHCIMGLDYNDGNGYRMSTMDNSSSNWHYSTHMVTTNTWHHCVWTLTTSKKKWYLNGVKQENTSDTFSFNNANTYHRLFHRHDNNYGFRGYADQACFWEKELTDQEVTDLYGSGSGNVYSAESLNATGNFTCPNVTAASATTKMGAVITYQDNSGTNALNTDIVLQLSADGGSNYSTATLTALPDFSTGIKMANVNDLTVTSGTQLKYKISFANQAQGSKEARIRGVSLNY